MADWHEYGEMKRRERARKLSGESNGGCGGCLLWIIGFILLTYLGGVLIEPWHWLMNLVH